MYAVIRTGGKQYRVAEGDIIRVDKIEQEVGQTVDFDDILLVGAGTGIKVDKKSLAGSQVKAEILEQGRHKKINIIKFKRRKHHLKRQGHRQHFTAVKITAINA